MKQAFCATAIILVVFLSAPLSAQAQVEAVGERVIVIDPDFKGTLKVHRPADATQHAHRRFDEADKNKDGVLSEDEMDDFIEKVKYETKKASGANTLATRQALQLRQHYREADKDGDDEVTKAEMEQYYATHPVNNRRDYGRTTIIRRD
ncbi:MAG: EF-hand domain-containing protein [Alphaproteobacteria bacterium]|nr:EF-hand domain-containing protein [Alphaproteobacteria bacterium]